MSFAALPDAELDELLGQFPALARGPRLLEDLDGGLTNRNVKVTTPTGISRPMSSTRATTSETTSRTAPPRIASGRMRR